MLFSYFFYFEYYVKLKEDRITSTRFRVLDQMGKNIDQRLGSYINNANDLGKKIDAEWKLINRKKRYSDTDLKIDLLIDSLNNKGDINKNLKVEDILTGDTKENLAILKEKRKSSKKYFFPVILKNPPFNPSAKDNLMVIQTSYSDLLKGLQRDDVFDGLILIRDTIIVYNTLGQEMLLEKSGDDDMTVEIESSEKSKKFSQSALGKIVSGEVLDITISNRSYKAFLKPISINNEIWYSIGLMKTGNFNAASRSIDPWIIVLLSLLLIFIILSMPFVKLKVLSKTEQLDTSTIINIALSSILGGTITVLFLIFLTQDYSSQNDVNQKLKSLSDTIYNSFTDELGMAYRQMEVYDAHFEELKFPDSTENPYNTKVVKDVLNTKEPYKPDNYKYGDYYFWTNTGGVQVAYLTPVNDYGDLTDLSKRDYVNKKDEWFFPDRDNEKFRLESIVSVTSGAVKAAISKKGNSPELPVVAISTKLYSIINTIIPKDYSFCIIDKSGKVWFHSNENLNLKENFINECNDDELLQSALYANISKSISVNYYNEPHRIYIQPIDNLPLYLVTLYNKKSIKSFQLQVITLSLLLLSILLFLLFVQIMVLLFIEGQYRLALTKNILMKLARPIMRLNGAYKYLINVYIIIQIIFIPFILVLHDMDAIMAIFMLVIILFAYSYLVLNENDLKIQQRKWFSLFNLFLLLSVNIVSIYFSKGNSYLIVLLFQVVIFLVLIFADRKLKKETKDNSNYWINYTRFLIAIMILFGLIPTLKFYEIAYNTETKFRVRHNLVDLMTQRESRNVRLYSDFRKMGNSAETRQVLINRKDLGIYINFNDSLEFYNELPAGFEPIYKTQNNHWDSLISFVRPVFDEYILENKFLLLNNPLNENMKWHSDGDNQLLEYNSLFEDVEQGAIICDYVGSYVPSLNLFVPFTGKHLNGWLTIIFNTLFWLFIVILVYVFYKLLRFGVSNIFCQKIIENYLHQDFKELLNYQMLANKDIFITRLSPKDETEDFLDDFNSKQGYLTISWADQNGVAKTTATINAFKKTHQDLTTISVLLSNFDWEFDDPDIFKEKIEVLKLYTNRKDIKLVLFSQVSPKTINKYYEEIIKEVDSKSGKKGQPSQMAIKYQELVAEFNYVMNSFLLDFLPVSYNQKEYLEDVYCKAKPRKISNENIIRNELYASDYLKQFEEAILDFNSAYKKKTNKEMPEELIISKINVLAENYFEDLFQSCTVEEQYVLFDISDDMIINPKNEKAIVSLLRKGILVKKCYKINLMNISFRRFVISKLDKATKTKLELVMGKDSGTWQGYRATLVLIIIALFVFIGMANQDFVDNLNQLFIALGGGIAVISGILGLMSRKKGSSMN